LKEKEKREEDIFDIQHREKREERKKGIYFHGQTSRLPFGLFEKLYSRKEIDGSLTFFLGLFYVKPF
jgi:hypothetical protein